MESESPEEAREHAALLLGRRLQYATIAWNLMEVFVTIGLGIAAHSLALVAFGLDSLVEVFASVVVIWFTLDHDAPGRIRRAHRLVAVAFAVSMWALIGFLSYSERTTAIETGREHGRNLSAAFSLELNHVLDRIDATLATIATDMPITADALDVRPNLAHWASDAHGALNDSMQLGGNFCAGRLTKRPTRSMKIGLEVSMSAICCTDTTAIWASI